MHFSCKITNAVLSFLEQHGEDLSSLYDPVFPAMETLRDSSSWMSAPDMEAFFETLVRMGRARGSEEALLVAAGHAGPRNHAWGVLDSVLRLMPRPQEILNQPERFLSYFISPEPPFENLRRSEASVSFDLPLPAEQYPLVVSYLKAAFESLPLYVGKSLATCEWEGIHLKVRWPDSQESIFDQDPGHQISPDLLQSVIADHQRLQRELEDKNREIQRKDDEIQDLRKDLEEGVKTTAVLNAEAALTSLLREDPNPEAPPAFMIEQNLARLHDYMVRAQQLVVVLAGLAKKDKEPAIKEALRRLDWDHVKKQYPRTISASMEQLRRLQSRTSSVRPSEEETHV
ncbi:MAG TPA: hypothetical protein PL182_08045 [Pseudobdellovibrionaceae bacterium]|nr:hypothetical protein [Pseudobdellovibrionaceae bacterium]